MQNIFATFDYKDRPLADELIAGLNAAGYTASPVKYSATISIPPRLVGRIFGHGGAGILRLRDQIGVQIFLELAEKGHITVQASSKNKVGRTISLIRAQMGPPIYPSLKKMKSPNAQVILLTKNALHSPQVHLELEEAAQDHIPLILYRPQTVDLPAELQNILAGANILADDVHDLAGILQHLKNLPEPQKEA
ncbi:MAG: hypothetical protein JXB38_20065 [Anaerolineales bacterium]|nr:hypothetical protein [Anaerolineales bacterium]